jgi:hypothetical protein
MIHLRVVAPPALADSAYGFLRTHPSALNVVRLRGAAEQPDGDLILCDVAREDASVIVAELRELGLERDGSIALDTVSALVSDAARRAEEAAVGSPADAVVWETVELQTSESAPFGHAPLLDPGSPAAVRRLHAELAPRAALPRPRALHDHASRARRLGQDKRSRSPDVPPLGSFNVARTASVRCRPRLILHAARVSLNGA